MNKKNLRVANNLAELCRMYTNDVVVDTEPVQLLPNWTIDDYNLMREETRSMQADILVRAFERDGYTIHRVYEILRKEMNDLYKEQGVNKEWNVVLADML